MADHLIDGVRHRFDRYLSHGSIYTVITESMLKTLVIDDSPTEAQTLAYLLTKRLRCQVETAGDGLEGLDKLSASRFDLVFLDIQMPLMSGVEVLREIRGSSTIADLPVIIISSNTDPQTIRELLELNIFDYVVKPYNAEQVVKRFTEKLGPLKSRALLPSGIQLPGEVTPREPGKLVLMIADEEANFRHFFISTLGAQYQVIEAANGGQAVALALKHTPNFVFASAKLGVFKREHMVAKLRKAPGLASTRIIAIDADGEAGKTDAGLYDGHVRRTFVPLAFKEAVDRILLGDAAKPVGKNGSAALQAALVSATEQVFGMMMSSEISLLEPSANLELGDAATFGTIELFGYVERTCLTLTFSCRQSCVIAMAMRMLQMDEAEASQSVELAHSTLAETLNMVGGRIKNSLEEEGRAFLLGLPKVAAQAPTTNATEREHGYKAAFAAGEGIQFSINVWTRPLTTEKVTNAKLSNGMALAAPIEVDAEKRWGIGSIVTADMIAEIKAGGFDEVEVFEPL